MDAVKMATRAVRGASKPLVRSPMTPARIARLLLAGTLEDAVAEKVVMITGASSGIGHASALRLGQAGAKVLLVARRADKLAELAGEINGGPGEAHVFACDLSDDEQIERMVGEVLAAHGRVDILVNNAGRSIRRSVALSYDRIHDYERTMALNYFGAVKLILAFLPGMRERGDGLIVNVSSGGVQVNSPRFSAYIASKAALDAFSACIASEIHRDGVRISTIYMPLVRTPMSAPTKIYRAFPALTPQEAANMVAEAVTTRARRIATTGPSLLGLAYTVSPAAVDAVVNGAYHLLPDSRAARN